MQSCRRQGEGAARTIAGVLPEITGQRHQADHGTPHAGTQDCSHYADSMEEGGKFRRCETEVASRLSVSGEEPLPSSAIFFWWWSVGPGDARCRGCASQSSVGPPSPVG